MSKKKIVVIILSIIMAIRIVICLHEETIYIPNTNFNVTILNTYKVQEEYIVYRAKYNFQTVIIYIYEEAKAEYMYGDVLECKGYVQSDSFLNNDGEFNYTKYLKSIGIQARVNVTKYKYINSNRDALSKIYSIKHKVYVMLCSKFSSYFSSLMYNSLFGKNAYLEDNTFKELGISFLLNASGINLAILIKIIDMLSKGLKKIINYIKKCLNRKKRKDAIKCSNKYFTMLLKALESTIKCLIILSYTFLCDSSLSLFKSVISYYLGKIFGKKLKKKYRYIISLYIILLINPQYIFSFSIIIGYVAIFAINNIYPLIYSYIRARIINKIGINKYNYLKNMLNKRDKRKDESFKEYVCNKIKIYSWYVLKYILKSITIYASIELSILPIIVYNFYSLNVTSVISNIIISPLINVLTNISMLTVIFYKLKHVADILLNISYIIMIIIYYITKILSKFSIVINFVKPNILCIICYYITLFLSIYGYKISYYFKYVYSKKKSYANIQNNNKILDNLKLIQIIAIILSIIYITSYNIYKEHFASFVYYFNVGQGNMALVKDKDTVMIVDMGSTSNENSVPNILLSFLKIYKITKIDAILITHFHSDHISRTIWYRRIYKKRRYND